LGGRDLKDRSLRSSWGKTKLNNLKIKIIILARQEAERTIVDVPGLPRQNPRDPILKITKAKRTGGMAQMVRVQIPMQPKNLLNKANRNKNLSL
jgi:hypothetical protein